MTLPIVENARERAERAGSMALPETMVAFNGCADTIETLYEALRALSGGVSDFLTGFAGDGQFLDGLNERAGGVLAKLDGGPSDDFPRPHPDRVGAKWRWRLGEAICWLRLWATRFADEHPEAANVARYHADFIEEIFDALERAGLTYTSQGFGLPAQSACKEQPEDVLEALHALTMAVARSDGLLDAEEMWEPFSRAASIIARAKDGGS